MDGLVSVFAHELAEATSSPFISTWFDGDGYENADKCSWKFAPLIPNASGIKYNLSSASALATPFSSTFTSSAISSPFPSTLPTPTISSSFTPSSTSPPAPSPKTSTSAKETDKEWYW
ncbi:unnamed protein product [Closterium sp. Naga37s-1]|nr:unnamed protein product [Closterium sp. Naga37s-1]